MLGEVLSKLGFTATIKICFKFLRLWQLWSSWQGLVVVGADLESAGDAEVQIEDFLCMSLSFSIQFLVSRQLIILYSH